MNLRHLAFFEFTATDLEDGFMYDLCKPDEAFFRMDDDGFFGERAAEKLISTRRRNGLPDAPVLETFLDQEHRRFVPAFVHELTVVKGANAEEAQAVFLEVVKWMNTNKTRVRGYQCGIFRWGHDLLWMHFGEPAAVAAVTAEKLGVKHFRYGVKEYGWRKDLTAAAFLKRSAD